MWWIFKKTKEVRADPEEKQIETGSDLLSALLERDEINKKKALEIPTVQSCIDIIAGTVACLPVYLYKNEDGKAKHVKDDRRQFLLSHETGDTLTAKQFWRAMIEDYYLSDGAYAYLNKRGTKIQSIHYVDSLFVGITKNEDPIFKSYSIEVNGTRYWPYEFLKLLRKTKDGATSESIVARHQKILSVAYESMKFEENLVKKGGNKKGFLKSAKKLTKEAIDALKDAYHNLYSNNKENVVVLNDGIDFQESSNTSVEMQMNENKQTNAGEIAELFNVPLGIVKGSASQNDIDNYIKFCITPLLADIETSINRDMLLEREKGEYYFAFDTKELVKASIKERYEAYKIGLDKHFLQVEEVRRMENMEPIGIEWIELGLDSVLYTPETKEIYTPNTNQTIKLDQKEGEAIED